MRILIIQGKYSAQYYAESDGEWWVRTSNFSGHKPTQGWKSTGPPKRDTPESESDVTHGWAWEFPIRKDAPSRELKSRRRKLQRLF